MEEGGDTGAWAAGVRRFLEVLEEVSPCAETGDRRRSPREGEAPSLEVRRRGEANRVEGVKNEERKEENGGAGKAEEEEEEEEESWGGAFTSGVTRSRLRGEEVRGERKKRLTSPPDTQRVSVSLPLRAEGTETDA